MKSSFLPSALAATIIIISTISARAEQGIASVYGGGGRTASGEHASSSGMTAAHKHYPFGSRVRVTNNSNGRSIIVRINDRGPFVRGRVIDLTYAGARALGFSGLARVSLHRMR